ncbi:Major Facilitator Superfamily protein [Seinonella peptonophila]|uniref:Major Facilitator Superfamily protein n=1 Tax=Seinonella peptonophila TaxID=112248 RepID=A0A1M4X128_9BACL|nr:MFS transporter [Seinonella peptonophila]SHE87155.1 Major Facilitator Superfamily protein [Seinonella peptonophila]
MNDFNNTKKLYLICFFNHFILAYVIERLFWEQHGITIAQVVYAEMIYSLTVILFEVPTGIIADRWGRKQMIILGILLGCFEFLILVFASSFWHFAVVMLIAGIGNASISGSEKALLFDSLLFTGNASTFEKYVGRLHAIELISALLAALSGGFLAHRFGFEFNYWISLISMLIALCLSFTLVEPPIKSELDELTSIKDYVVTSLRFFRNHPGIYLTVLTGMITGAVLNYIDEFWQLYLKGLNIPVLYFGLFSASMMISRIPGNLFAHILIRRYPYRTIFIVMLSAITFCFLYITWIHNITSLIMILIICICTGLIEPTTTGYLHHRIDSSLRATLDSFQNLGEKIFIMLIGVGFGFFASKVDIFGGFGFISLMCLIYLFCFLFTSKRYL